MAHPFYLSPRKWVSTGIYSVNRASEWIWLETQETPQNGQNVRGFQVRTPICHIVPVSRAYPPPPVVPFPPLKRFFQGVGVGVY